ncbi:hypothetical protein [Vibrio phage Va2]|nr:hypothetical protein [Vibrio phage Va2]
MKVINTKPLVIDFEDIIITVKHSNRPTSALVDSIAKAMEEVSYNEINTLDSDYPEIYKPECLNSIEEGDLMIAYGIGESEDGSNQAGMWDGPNPDLGQMLNRPGRSDNSYIFELPSGVPLYQWSDENNFWVKIL